MTTRDQCDNPVSHPSAEAVARLDRIVEKLHAYQADPIADVDALLADHPDFVMAHAFRAGAITTGADRAYEPELRRTVEAAEALLPGANDRERGHIAACRAWLDGRFDAAVDLWGRTAIDHPRDLLAVQLAQLGDLYLGQTQMLRDRVLRVLPHWDASVPGYGLLLGMQAFGLEETADYGRAERLGREAVTLDAQDAWAAHAVAHVMEMTGRANEGIAWLGTTSEGWSPGGMLACHNWWHMALMHLDNRDVASALKVYDARVAATGFNQLLELVDASAFLWRVTVLGHDVGGRWLAVARHWNMRIDDGYFAFNDAHAMMAFVGAGNEGLQEHQIATLKRAAEGAGFNAASVREVGIAVCLGLQAFGQGDYAAAVRHLLPVRAKAPRFGGSHAQRDVLAWTLVEAAIRGGDRRLAESLAAERLALKPNSSLNRAWLARAADDLRRAA